MATGFVQRFKGKINVGRDGFFVHGQPVYGKPAQQSLTLISSSLGASTATGSYINIISSGSTTQSIIRQSKPVYAGQELIYQISTLNGLGVIITFSTDGSVTLNGSSCTVAKTTGSTVQTISLQATSTANWAIVAAYPFAGSSVTSLVTLSTSS